MESHKVEKKKRRRTRERNGVRIRGKIVEDGNLGKKKMLTNKKEERTRN